MHEYNADFYMIYYALTRHTSISGSCLIFIILDNKLSIYNGRDSFCKNKLIILQDSH